MTSKLFIDDLVPIDEFYGMIRDCKREEVLNGKCYMEHLWERYYKYADKDFPQKLS